MDSPLEIIAILLLSILAFVLIGLSIQGVQYSHDLENLRIECIRRGYAQYNEKHEFTWK